MNNNMNNNMNNKMNNNIYNNMYNNINNNLEQINEIHEHPLILSIQNDKLCSICLQNLNKYIGT